VVPIPQEHMATRPSSTDLAAKWSRQIRSAIESSRLINSDPREIVFNACAERKAHIRIHISLVSPSEREHW